MKNKIKELMVITTNSKTLEEFKENYVPIKKENLILICIIGEHYLK